jgi:hypothetical protein
MCRFEADQNFRFTALVILPLGAIGKFDAEVMRIVLKFGKNVAKQQAHHCGHSSQAQTTPDSVPRLQSRGYGLVSGQLADARFEQRRLRPCPREFEQTSPVLIGFGGARREHCLFGIMPELFRLTWANLVPSIPIPVGQFAHRGSRKVSNFAQTPPVSLPRIRDTRSNARAGWFPLSNKVVKIAHTAKM